MYLNNDENRLRCYEQLAGTDLELIQPKTPQVAPPVFRFASAVNLFLCVCGLSRSSISSIKNMLILSSTVQFKLRSDKGNKEWETTGQMKFRGRSSPQSSRIA
ncbi:hypothetical protein NQ317_001010 [Molorchus minor]|uniref:Uncharacterized protein n=1 Tax=Molorchus minor TaxID=1323400 RepID=A0ABQ9J9H4_9CUCU|nr:hypothetical protein NQ317_001010 [Molorchus minor]